MKKILSLLLALIMTFSFSLCLSGCDQTDLDDDGESSVKSSDNDLVDDSPDGFVTVWVIDSFTAYEDDLESAKAVCEYDDWGNLVKRIDTYNTEEYINSYIYDEYNNTIEEIIDGHTVKYTYVYDENGKIVEKSVYNGTMLLEHWVCTYDEAGKLVEEKREDGMYDPLKKVYIYDEGDVLTEMLCYPASGEMEWRVLYNDQGEVSEVFEYDPDYMPNHLSHHWKYDEMGMVTESYENIWDMSEDHHIYSYTYHFDDKGNLIQYICYENGAEDYRGIFEYTANNKMNGEILNRSENWRIVCEYTAYRVTPKQRDRLNELGATWGHEDWG